MSEGIEDNKKPKPQSSANKQSNQENQFSLSIQPRENLENSYGVGISSDDLSENNGRIHDSPNDNSFERTEVMQTLHTQDNLPSLTANSSCPSAPPLSPESSYSVSHSNAEIKGNDDLKTHSSRKVEESKNRTGVDHPVDVTDYLPSFAAATAYQSDSPLNQITRGAETGDFTPDITSEISSDHVRTGSLSQMERELQENLDNQKIFNTTLKNIRFGINLVTAAKRLLTFLKLVDGQSDLYKGEKVKAAIYRYEHFWLPLVAENSEVTISPPLDVHWIWIVHMLSPCHYEQDCLKIVGKVIPHRLMTLKALIKSREFGRAAWERRFPNMNWDLSLEAISQSNNFHQNSAITYHLEDAVLRQSAFFYQVSMEHYNCKAFLCKSVHRYKQFLALKKAHPNKFLVPCYDIDIIWHSHQVHPILYKQTTTKLLGQLFPHDDSVNDRSEGSKLTVSDVNTRDLWLTAFGTTFRREGAMFRGDPPSAYLNPVPETVLNSAHVSQFHIGIHKVKIKGDLPNGPLRVKLKQENQKLANFTLFHSGSGTSEHNVTEMNLEFSVSERGLKNWIVLKICSDKKIGKLLKFLGKGTFWSMTDLTELFSIGEEGTVKKVFQDDQSSFTVELELKVTRELTASWVPIGIMTGNFMPCVLSPQTLTSLFGMVTSTKSGNQDIYLAEMATHRLLNESDPSKPQLMEVEVYHSRHFFFSAIHLYMDIPSVGRTLIALAHTIDLNTIPSPTGLKYNIGSQLEAKVPTLNTNAGERAMLIKTKGKDWALLIGRWEGLRRGIKGSFSERGVPGSPGYLVVRIYSPIGADPVIVTLPYEKQVYAFQLPGLYIDMESGRLQVVRESEELVEQVILGLAITVLHVLCQPRHAITTDIDEVDGPPPTQQPLPIPDDDATKRIPAERLKFLAALGFFCASAPTNTRLTKNAMKDVDDKTRNHRGTSLVGGYLPLYAYPGVASGIGACGSCGGCGGCGGGVIETLGAPNTTLWGSSTHGGDGDGGGWGGIGSSDAGGAESMLFSALFDSGGGDGGGDAGGDGGGCGSCGGCGGCGG